MAKTNEPAAESFWREFKLCNLGPYEHRTELKEIRALVENPKFVCRDCGRVAQRPANLCAPTGI